ncbi:uncharacterized protein C2845_PM11G05810 [Panicum miliaceum]|uniref:DNA-directed RNA polymerase III subunit RPC4-like n=1 Tax=Panicum miliaceum TaxID=4540 RepID=A0A3L6RPI9_PANMI|nr:uncharacterized protein C2845_PM11G05810 [Panicum miliaceum]
MAVLHFGPKEGKTIVGPTCQPRFFLFFLPDGLTPSASQVRRGHPPIPPLCSPVHPLLSLPGGDDSASGASLREVFVGRSAGDEYPPVALMENEDMKSKETDDSTPQRRRKSGLKFSPKVLPKKAPKIIPKTEPQEENKALTIDKKLMTKLGSLQHIIPSIIWQSTYGPRSGTKVEKQGTSAVKLPKEHNEPWLLQDYTSTNGPVTLPLTRPNSGDTGSHVLLSYVFCGMMRGVSLFVCVPLYKTKILEGRAQDGELSAAEEFGLMERVDTHTPQLLFFQFPKTLPLPRQADADADTNMNMNAKSMGDNRKRQLDSIHGCGLKELPDGFMGKILVFKSGKVKMTLGDVLFDVKTIDYCMVSAGSNCMFPQEVVAINTREKHCCSIGDIGKRAIITPDINSLLGSVQI